MSYRLAALATLAALASLGLGPISPPGPPKSELVKVRVSVVSPDRTMREEVRQVRAAQLLGNYYQGDGLGINLSLGLRDGAKFDCTWHGCLGVYGKASGTWSLGDSGVQINTRESEGMLKHKPLNRLRVVAWQGHYLLVQERDLDSLKQRGPDSSFCFHQEAARKAFEDEWRRRINEAIKQVQAQGAKPPPNK
jgi:hypothetical protein